LINFKNRLTSSSSSSRIIYQSSFIHSFTSIIIDHLLFMKILLQEYQLQWKDQFELERNTIASAIAKWNPQIEHIGSTSIPGLKAKPIIDILIGLERAEFLDEIIAPLNAVGLFYHKAHEVVMPFRRFFIRLHNVEKYPDLPKIMSDYAQIPNFETEDKKVHIHIVQKEHTFWSEHILFRDKLRENDEQRDAYADLKTRLSQMDWKNGSEYAKAKGDFIRGVLAS